MVGCFSGKRHHKQNHISRGRLSFELPARSLSWEPSSPWRSLAFLGEAWSADATVASQMLWLVYSPGGQRSQHTWSPCATTPGRSTAAPQLLLQAPGAAGNIRWPSTWPASTPRSPRSQSSTEYSQGWGDPLHALLSLWGFLKRRKVPQAVWADGGSGLVCRNCGRRRGHAFNG